MGRYQNDEEWLRAMMEAARAGKPGTFRERKAAGLSTAPRGFGSPPTGSGGGGASLSESDSGSDSDEAAAGLAEEGWLKSGSEWIGRGVCRTFYGHVSAGRVVYWIPANDEGDEALWKVRHDDGDMEDLDEEELKAAHKDYLRYSENEANGPVPGQPPRRGGAGAAANGGSPFRRGTVAATLPNAEERARLKALYKQVLGKHPQGRYQNDLPWLRSAIKAAGGDHTEGAGCEAPKKREPAAEQQKTQPGEAMVALRGGERKEEEQEREQQGQESPEQQQDQEQEQEQGQEQEEEQEQDGEDGQAAQGEEEEAGGAGALTQEELEEQWPVLLGAQAAVCGHAMTHVTFDSL